MAPKPFYLLLWNTLILVNVVALGTTGPEPKLHFTHQPQDVVAIRNERLVLNCSAIDDAGLAVNITWRKDGQVLNDRRRYVLPDGSLLIKRVLSRKQPDKNDEGIYECLARTTIGTIASRKFRIQIANLTPFSGEPQSSTVSVGETVRFQCQVEASPPAQITWERHRQPLPQDTRYTILTSGVLQIQDVQLTDAGPYRCHAQNVARERHSSEALLAVSSDQTPKAAQLLAGPQHVSKLAGESVVLECAITAIPISYKIVWLHADRREVNDRRMKILGQGNLLIEDIKEDDAGVYLCSVVQEPDSPGSVMAQARLDVLAPPKMVYTPSSLMKQRAHTTRFICGFTGQPRPTVRWLKNGQPIDHNGRIRIKEYNFYGDEGMLGEHEVGSMLVLWQSMTSDSGLYQCQAENAVGQVSHSVRLYVEPSDDSPDSPKDLVARADRDSSNKIFLSWTASPPKNNHRILAYSVHYLPTAGGAELQKVITETTVTIDQLMPHTNYTFYVVAYNEMSASESSVMVTQMTREDVPVSAPWVTVTPLGSTQLKVAWDPLDPGDARGVITRYRIHYRKYLAASENHIEVPGSTLEYTLTGLDPGQKYDVRVVGGTKLGFPALVDQDWHWVTENTDPDRNIGAPGPPKMQVQALNSSSIMIMWEEPPMADGMPLVGYMLHFGKPGDVQKTVVWPPDHAKNHILKELDGDSLYEISLHAFNDMADGEAVVKQVRTPLPSERSPSTPVAPPAPHDVEAEPVNATAITIQWKKPSFPSRVSSYTLRYSPVVAKEGRELTDDSQVKFVTSKLTKIVVKGLIPYTNYEISVKSHTQNAEGQYGSEIRCRTLEGKPSPPQNPHAVRHSASSVELHWEPPVDSNGVIVSYIISYTEDEHKQDDFWLRHKENGTMTQAYVGDLDTNSLYFFKLRAATKVGVGDPSKVLRVEPDQRAKGFNDLEHGDPTRNNDKEMGIIVGACIGGGCIIICAIIILLRNKCFPPRLANSDPALTYVSHNGSPPYMNGNGYLSNGVNHHLDDSSHEMDRFLPRMTTLPENEHSDSKGGNDVFFKQNGRVNGLVPHKRSAPANGIRPNHVPNGRRQYLARERYNSCTSSEDGPEVPLRSASLAEGQQPGVVSEEPGPDVVGANVNNGCSVNETSVDVSSDCGVVDVDTCSTDCEAHSPQDFHGEGQGQGHSHPPPPSRAHQEGGARHGHDSNPLPPTTSHSSVSPQCLSQASRTPPPPPPHKGNRGKKQASGYNGQQQQQQQGERPQPLPSSQAQVSAPQQQQQQQHHLSSFLPHRSKQVSEKAALPQSRSQGSHCQRLSPNAGLDHSIAPQPSLPGNQHNHHTGNSQDNVDLHVASRHSHS